MLATNEKKKKKKKQTLGKPKTQTCQPHLAHEVTNLQSQFHVLENLLLLKLRGEIPLSKTRVGEGGFNSKKKWI